MTDERFDEIREECKDAICTEFGEGKRAVSPFYSDNVRVYFADESVFGGTDCKSRDIRVIWDLPETKVGNLYVVFECDFLHPDNYSWAIRDLAESDWNGNGLAPEECHSLEASAELAEDIDAAIQNRIVPHLEDLKRKFENESEFAK